LNVSQSNGTNVLDGSTGSNFMVGGTGNDTFFVDDRNAPSDIWSTVSGFHSGDGATVFGVTKDDFALNFFDGLGAAGFTGLTLLATANGKPPAALTLAGFSKADLSNGKLSVSFGVEADGSGPFMFIKGN
jgi:Ca2+-binding RTX toxin-like protein